MPEGDTVWNTARVLERALAGRRADRVRLPGAAAGHRRPRPAGRCVESAQPRQAPAAAAGDAGGDRPHAALAPADGRRVAGVRGRASAGPAGRAHLIRVVLRTARRRSRSATTCTSWRWSRPPRSGRCVGHLGPDLLGADWDPDEAVRRLAAQARRHDRRGPARPAQPRRHRQPLQGRDAVPARRVAVDAGRRRCRTWTGTGRRWPSGCSPRTRAAGRRPRPARCAAARPATCTAGAAQPCRRCGTRDPEGRAGRAGHLLVPALPAESPAERASASRRCAGRRTGAARTGPSAMPRSRSVASVSRETAGCCVVADRLAVLGDVAGRGRDQPLVRAPRPRRAGRPGRVGLVERRPRRRAGASGSARSTLGHPVARSRSDCSATAASSTASSPGPVEPAAEAAQRQRRPVQPVPGRGGRASRAARTGPRCRRTSASAVRPAGQPLDGGDQPARCAGAAPGRAAAAPAARPASRRSRPAPAGQRDRAAGRGRPDRVGQADARVRGQDARPRRRDRHPSDAPPPGRAAQPAQPPEVPGPLVDHRRSPTAVDQPAALVSPRFLSFMLARISSSRATLAGSAAGVAARG